MYKKRVCASKHGGVGGGGGGILVPGANIPCIHPAGDLIRPDHVCRALTDGAASFLFRDAGSENELASANEESILEREVSFEGAQTKSFVAEQGRCKVANTVHRQGRAGVSRDDYVA